MIELVLADKTEELRKEREDTTEGLDIASLPAFQVTDLSGKPITKESLSGKIVLVEFWATWCPPCRSTLSWLGTLQKKYGNRLAVVAIAIESEEKDVKQVANSLNIPLQWAMGNPDVVRAFGDISAVPTLYLFDTKGSTVATFYGAPPDLHSKAEQALTAVMK